MNFMLPSFLNMLLTIGTLCLFRWLPVILQRVLFAHASEIRSRFEYVLGAIGVICYLTQIALLLFVECAPLMNLPSNIRYMTMAAVAVAIALFGVGVFNFVRAAVLRAVV